jgi:4-hydroxy-2-oxoheptanedioate aldolase
MDAASAGSPLVPLVRVAATSVAQAKVPLDFSVIGVCFPMITTRADAEAVVRAVRYPPAGVRAGDPSSA